GVCPAAMGVLEVRAPTLATAGPAMPSIINVAAATAATILRCNLGTFRRVSTEILQQARTGDSPSPDGIRLDPQPTTVVDTQLARQRIYAAGISTQPHGGNRHEDPLTRTVHRCCRPPSSGSGALGSTVDGSHERSARRAGTDRRWRTKWS